jgi:hypothetical protein
VSLAAGASIEERRELPIGASSGLAAVGSANTIVRAEAVEAVAPDRITFLDSLPTGATEEQRAGRSVTVEIPTSSVLERAPTRPNVGPSLGQVFDRIVENNRLAPSSRPSHLAPGAMPVCVSPSTDRPPLPGGDDDVRAAGDGDHHGRWERRW